ncbi:MAG: hypothetical protein K2Q26_14975, partial [Bdellovibrionales bacterium]|nr:hypothetical protein [Bdellovibrionales bacterium]
MSDLDHIHCEHDHHHHHQGRRRWDIIYIFSTSVVICAYILAVFPLEFFPSPFIKTFSHHVFELMNKIGRA